MPRKATPGTEPALDVERATSFPPPPPRSPARERAEQPIATASLAEAEALARVAMLSASSDNDGPSRGVVGVLVGLGVLVVSMILLAVLVTAGPHPA